MTPERWSGSYVRQRSTYSIERAGTNVRIRLSEGAQPEPGARGYLRLVLLGAVIGIPAALLASVFLAVVHDVEHWLWHDLPQHLDQSSPPWYLVIGLPVAGACLVAIARSFLPGDGGHSPLPGFAGKPPLISYALGIALAAIGTLSFGAVLGPEGPLIALGAVVGILITRLARLGAQESAVLANAGSFAAISALFGGPVVGGVLMMEGAIGFGAATISILLPGFVAAGAGYLVFVGFGDWGGLHAQAITFTGLPEYTGVHPGDLALAVLVGVLTALVVVVVRRLGFSVSDREKRVGIGPAVRPSTRGADSCS
jgi:H+/Cl- antiporter ClcA